MKGQVTSRGAHRAGADQRERASRRTGGANDNPAELAPQLGDPLIVLLGRMDIAATRVW